MGIRLATLIILTFIGALGGATERQNPPPPNDFCQNSLQAEPSPYVWHSVSQRTYRSFHKPALDALFEEMSKMRILPESAAFLQFARGRSFLSLGEGDSDLVKALLERGFNATAVDVCLDVPGGCGRKFAQAMQQDPNHYKRQLFQALDLGAEFDLVYASYSLNYVIAHAPLESERTNILTRILRHVRDGGMLITLPHAGNLSALDDVVSRLNESGWRVTAYPLIVATARHPFPFSKGTGRAVSATVVQVHKKPAHY